MSGGAVSRGGPRRVAVAIALGCCSCRPEVVVFSAPPAELAESAASDRDGDGVPDADDRCVGEPEIINGYADEDGCPDDCDVGLEGLCTAELHVRFADADDTGVIAGHGALLLEKLAWNLRKFQDSEAVLSASDASAPPELAERRLQAITDILRGHGVDDTQIRTGRPTPSVLSHVFIRVIYHSPIER
ncbi:MAG: hypothetical protein R3A79_01500 [Nannocystaceae bacterium]